MPPLGENRGGGTSKVSTWTVLVLVDDAGEAVVELLEDDVPVQEQADVDVVGVVEVLSGGSLLPTSAG
ncbi:hypothetical protein [Spirosoma gilvum]